MQTPKYSIIDTGKHSPSNIRIADGPGKGLVYRYGKVDLPTAGGNLRFVYEVIENPNKVDPNSPAIRQAMGDILVECIQQSMADQDGIIMIGK